MRNCVLVLWLVFCLAIVGCGSGSTSSGGSGSGGDGGGASTPSTVGEWTWMGGSQSYDALPASTWPGATEEEDAFGSTPPTWRDSSGNLWMFGGGIDSTGAVGAINAMWKMTPLSETTTAKWTVERGSITLGSSACVSNDGVYAAAGAWGTRGTASVANTPSGRLRRMSWTDASGNLWLFGGTGCDAANNYTNYMNDLWRFDPATAEWTWVAGGSTATPYDSTTGNGGGNAGVYGTRGTASTANTPGGREGAMTWTDANGNLWLFGGYGCDSTGLCLGFLNDLWKFSPSTGEWTWMGGADTSDFDHNTATNGVYGTRGTASPSNMPGAREDAAAWTDASGNLWLFGGYGDDASGNLNWLSDVWEYSTTTGEWTWMGGSDIGSDTTPAVYGTKGTASAANTPGARINFAYCSDASGNLWLFGGDVPAGQGNDLWEYSTTTGEWTWQAGSNTPDKDGTSGVYGTEGVAAAGNVPPSRASAACWFDVSGNLWLFGGAGGQSDTGKNDLWFYRVVE